LGIIGREVYDLLPALTFELDERSRTVYNQLSLIAECYRAFAAMKADIKMIAVVTVIVACLSPAHHARAKVETGSVVVVMYNEDQAVMAADSRRTNVATGRVLDDDCKIAAFGDKFIAGWTGASHLPTGITSKTVTLRIWRAESSRRGKSTNRQFVHVIASAWQAAMIRHWTEEADAVVIDELSKQFPDQEGIAAAIFASLDSGLGVVDLCGTNINFDRNSRDRFHGIPGPIVDLVGPKPGPELVLRDAELGSFDIALEYLRQTTPRAKEFMQSFVPYVESLAPEKRAEEMARKMVELQIKLGGTAGVGGNIDVLELGRGIGTHWVQAKEQCRDYSNNRPGVDRGREHRPAAN
jgi:hypothetical protein